MAITAAVQVQAQPGDRYRAEIRRTEYGIPHVRAADYGGLGFGEAWVTVQDQLCFTAHQIALQSGRASAVTRPASAAEAERAAAADLLIQAVDRAYPVAGILAQPAPRGPSQNARELVEGYAAGYNQALAARIAGNDVPPACAGQAWLRPISAEQVWAMLARSGLLAGSFGQPMRQAAPPQQTPGRQGGIAPDANAEHARSVAAASLGNGGTGEASNVIAVGADLTETGRGMLLANPHWLLRDRRRTLHSTIPGELDTFGQNFVFAPGVARAPAFNGNVAWSQTVTVARGFVVYRVRLDAADPMAFTVAGQSMRIRPIETDVEAMLPDGGTRRISHTFYHSPLGFVLGGDAYPWTEREAYIVVDPLLGSAHIVDLTIAMAKARSVREFDAALSRYPTRWFTQNVGAVDSAGNAYYSGSMTTISADDAYVARCVTRAANRELVSRHLVIVDLSVPDCLLPTDPDAALPGLAGGARVPRLFNRSYTVNGNDTHWISNATTPLAGYSRFFTDGQVGENRALTLRTRALHWLVHDRAAGTDGLPGRRFTHELLRQSYFEQPNSSARMARDGVVAACRAAGSARATDGISIDLREACEVLAAWDLRSTPESRGQILWRRFWLELDPYRHPFPTDLITFRDEVFRAPFDPRDPVNTPRDFDATRPEILVALADSVQAFRREGVALALPVGEGQRLRRAGQEFAAHGCSFREGCINAFRPEYPERDNLMRGVRSVFDDTSGTSGFWFFMIVSFDAPDTPRAEMIFLSGSSEDPSSPHYTDQLSLNATQGTFRVRYAEAEIEASPVLTRLVVEGPR
jgi:acyl-homoserine-lactone acylase